MAGIVGACFVDIHAHFFSLTHYDKNQLKECAWPVILSSHGIEEMQALADFSAPWLWRSAGIHPQDARIDLLPALASQLTLRNFCAVGEIGFDLCPEYVHTLEDQKTIFLAQLELAQQYDLPVILHVRRAMPYIFQYKHFLKKIRAVIFHSYAGSYIEANSLLKTGINAYFSFGTPVLWGAKQANLCLKNLPLERIFLETDAPWQPVRGEVYTALNKIKTVYAYAAQARNIEIETLQSKIFSSFDKIFILPLTDDRRSEHAEYLQDTPS